MNKSLLTLTFTPSVVSADEDLIIEQKEWNPGTGYVTKLAFMKFVGGIIYGTDGGSGFGESISCELDDEGNFNTTIYVYPFDPNMLYSIDTTHGLLGDPPIIATVDKVEVIALKLADSASSKYPVLQVKEAIAVGDLYDRNGNQIPIDQITITMTGTSIELSQKVYGSIAIKYSTTRHTYPLYVTRRSSETSLENFYSSIVYAWWNGGVKWLDVVSPDGAEERTGDRPCGHGKTGITGSGPVKNRPVAAYADRRISVDYCSLEILSDSLYPDTEWDDVNQY